VKTQSLSHKRSRASCRNNRKPCVSTVSHRLSCSPSERGRPIRQASFAHAINHLAYTHQIKDATGENTEGLQRSAKLRSQAALESTHTSGRSERVVAHGLSNLRQRHICQGSRPSSCFFPQVIAARKKATTDTERDNLRRESKLRSGPLSSKHYSFVFSLESFSRINALISGALARMRSHCSL